MQDHLAVRTRDEREGVLVGEETVVVDLSVADELELGVTGERHGLVTRGSQVVDGETVKAEDGGGVGLCDLGVVGTAMLYG
jgi:hypothetical protein